MIELTLAEVASAVGGRLHAATGSERITGSVEFDSREVAPGGLFVALPGERVDGHDFAEVAVRAGAAGVLAGRVVDAPSVIVPPAASVPGEVYVLAADRDGSGAAVLTALGRLARAVVDRLVGSSGLTVIGVTGSSGKTSTKDLIAALAGPLGPTVAPPGSFNNELGHPWTVLRAGHDTRHLVLELSARGRGHVASLCEVAPPRIGLVLNVGSAHLGEFGSREAIAQAKGELVEALPADGVAVLNADDELVCAMAARTAARVVRFGEAPDAAVRAVDVTVDGSGRAAFRLVTSAGDAEVVLAVHGRHQVGNALAAAAVALELGADVHQIAEGLRVAAPVSRWRMEVRDRHDGLTVINDAYNANPESVRAALRTLTTMAAGSSTAGTARRSWAVLGPIAELGDGADSAHFELGGFVTRLGVDRLVVVGEQARALHEGARHEGARREGARSNGEESVFVPDVDAAVALLRGQLRAGDLVLVKASRAFGLERVAAALLAEDGSRDGEAR